MIGQEAHFEVVVTLEDCWSFAQLSGDWNPLHTDPDYAKTTGYGRQVLHGAFSAGLISKLAGMHLPGQDCLLHGLRLRFVAPILPPANLSILGKVVSFSNEVGRVNATVRDAASGQVYVEGSYHFGYHRRAQAVSTSPEAPRNLNAESVVLVTGASGGLGSAVMNQLGGRGQAVSRNAVSGRIEIEELASVLGKRRIGAIVHCGWPAPEDSRFMDLQTPKLSIEEHIAGPIRDVQTLAAFLADNAGNDPSLILVGSTGANPGRHNFRQPLYSIAKATVPVMVQVLSLELASKKGRCLGVVFDMLDGGMNEGISQVSRLANADRSPLGKLASTQEAAEQVVWCLENQSRLLNGSVVTLSGGSLP